MIEYILALVFSGVAGWLLSGVGTRALDSAVSGFAGLIGGWRGDGWPRGVQEEDRDRPWGTPAPATHVSSVLAMMDNAHAVATSRLHGRTRVR